VSQRSCVLTFSLVTNTLNTSLHTHSQTLALLALQRNTTGLPFALISPGRNLVRRGPLLQLEGAADPRARDFLLFSDCILWLAAADGGDGALDSKWEWTQRRAPLSAGGDVAPATAGAADDDTPPAAPARPGMQRRRSKSDASHANVRNARAAAQAQRISEGGAGVGSPAKARSALPKPRKAKRAPSVAAGAQEERWLFKGRAELVDVDVVVSPLRDEGDERRFEILSPEASFAVYAGKLRSSLFYLRR
jgi:FYVE/RhoGEF/PH domain-containing protein 5/6